jgi:hypothetical protein
MRYKERLPVAAPPIATGNVSLYIIWENKLLIFKKGVIAVPRGKVNPEESNMAAAQRLLTGMAITDVSGVSMKSFKQVNENENGSTEFFTVVLQKKPENITLGDEVDVYEFTGIEGEKAAAGAFWAHVPALRVWLHNPANKSLRDPALYSALGDISAALGTPVNKNLDIMPEWSETFIKGDANTAMRIKKAIFTGDKFSKEDRLSHRLSDPALVEYDRLVDAIESIGDDSSNEKQIEKRRLQMELEDKYKAAMTLIRDPNTGEVHEYVVPNPYVALSYREDPITNFAEPNKSEKSSYNADGKLRGQNIQLLTKLAPKELIANKPMAVALLESLWYCGQNPSVSNDPRCFPARLLGELREYAEDKIQKGQAVEADEVFKRGEWHAIKPMLEMLRNSVAGAEIFTFDHERLMKHGEKAPVSEVPAQKEVPAEVPEQKEVIAQKEVPAEAPVQKEVIAQKEVPAEAPVQKDVPAEVPVQKEAPAKTSVQTIRPAVTTAISPVIPLPQKPAKEGSMLPGRQTTIRPIIPHGQLGGGFRPVIPLPILGSRVFPPMNLGTA